MSETIMDRRRRMDRLSMLYAILQHQKDVMVALNYVTDTYLPVEEGTTERALALRSQVATEIVLTCEAIWELSGPKERAR